MFILYLDRTGVVKALVEHVLVYLFITCVSPDSVL